MYLITPTLLEGYRYYMKSAKSRQEFLDSLAKVKMEPTDLMKKGIEFENEIRKIAETCDRYDLEYMTEVYKEVNERDDPELEIARIVRGGLWQVSCQKELQIETDCFLLYGRCDVIKEDTIYDIKFTQNYEVGKYCPSSQHLIYMYCTGLSKFTYLVSDGKDWWPEDYFAESDLEDRVRDKVFEFRNYLRHDKEAEALFIENWRAK